MGGIAHASFDWPAQHSHHVHVLVQNKYYLTVFESPKEDVLFANTISDVALCFHAFADPCRNRLFTAGLLAE